MDEIKQILEEFADLIVNTQILTAKEGEDDGLFQYKLLLKLKNGNRLIIDERMTRLGYRYSYQWMESDNTLIIRWDDAPHTHEVATMPHHKHVGSNENVQSSEEMNTRKVLQFIAKIIGIFVLIGFTALWFWK